MPAEAPSPAADRPRVPPAAIVTLVVGLLASAAVWWLQQRATDQTVDERFQSVVREAADSIDGRLAAVESASLATRALFESSDEVTAGDFAAFANSLSAGASLSDRYPGVASLAVVDAASLAVDVVAPVADPLGLRSRRFADGAIAGALDEATTLAIPVVTVLPPSERPEGTQLAVVTAVYGDERAAQSTATDAVRRSGLWGWVVVFVDGEGLLEGLLPADVPDAHALLLSRDGDVLVDLSPISEGRVERRRDVFLNLRGATITLRLEVGQAFTTRFERRVPLLLLAGGTLLTALLAALVWLISTQRSRALVMVDEATAALADANEDLAESNQRLRDFTGVVAHDLKNPLVSVQGFVSLVARQFRDTPDERTKDFLARALAGTDRMKHLIDDLLAYAVADRELGATEPVDVDDLVATSILDSLEAARQPGDQIEVVTGATVEANLPAMRQLFSNLLGNALKFRRTDQPARIRVAAELADGRWVVTVADNGIGIPAEERQRVLEAFARAETDREGTGLGLAICQKIVAAHGGDITVDESPLGGTAITFDLPAVP